jgi:predicted component of type VI protein secretion system
MAKNYMQFETRGLGEHARPGTDVKIAFCVTPSVTFADKMKTVVIDNELADIDRDIIQRLAETIKAADIKGISSTTRGLQCLHCHDGRWDIPRY